MEATAALWNQVWHSAAQGRRGAARSIRQPAAASGNRSMEVDLMGTLLSKLDKLLVAEYSLQKAEKGKIRFLKGVLEIMQDALKEISNIPADQLPDLDKMWTRNVRELSYDIEDIIDAFMVGYYYEGVKPTENKGFKMAIDRSLDLLMQQKIRRNIASDIKDDSYLRPYSFRSGLKRRNWKGSNPLPVKTFLQSPSIPLGWGLTEHGVKGFSMRRNVANNIVAKPTTNAHFLLDQYKKATQLIGIDGPRDEIIKTLVEGSEGSGKQLKIISIVGLRGLGKTTLANAVYEKLSGQFDCWAFVSVSSNPDIKKLLKDTLSSLGKNPKEEMDERQLFCVLREFLQTKRYFIVLDDIQNISDWEMIRDALPDSNGGSRIITTTRNLSVAKQVGGVYELNPLSLENSRRLFYRIIFGTENMDKGLYEQLHEISDRILRKCAGVPLAIIMIACVLASKERNQFEWYNVYNLVSTRLKDSLTVDHMRNIFSLSYYELPSHLRTCLLYMSIFPGDYGIEKDRLIWMWIAEGFVECEEPRESQFELGETYFYELISRSVIQPVYGKYSSMIEYCRLHSSVHDFICDLSRVENHVTVMNNVVNDTSPPTHCTMHDIVVTMARRLSLQNGKVDPAMSRAFVNMGKLRSVAVFPSVIDGMPSFQRFKVVRLLDLQDCHISEDRNVKFLGNLPVLRYLGLRRTCINQLPPDIEKLQCLQTIDVRGNQIPSLPPTISKLGKLMCLRLDSSTEVPKGIGRLTSLEVLSTIGISIDSTNIIDELVHLKALRDLHICYHVEGNDILGKSIVKALSNKQYIRNLCIDFSSDNDLDYSWIPPRSLRTLELKGCWHSTLQSWVKPSILPNLSFLSFNVRKLQQNDLETLGALPALSYLRLTMDPKSIGKTGRFFVIRPHSFPSLVNCMLLGSTVPVVFQPGAMPRLESIEFTFPVQDMREIPYSNVGLVNLLSIQDVTVLFNYGGASEEDLEEAEAALGHEVELHPNRPTLRIVTADKSDVEGHLKEVPVKSDRYKIDGPIAKPVTTTVFPCLSAQYMKAEELIGIEDTINELTNILTERNEPSMEQGKIVSIVGPGGLGKTTLARAVYEKLRAEFDCCAFVTVSQNPDMKKLFKCMLYQLGKKNDANIHDARTLDERLLVYELSEFLQHRRYIIVIDDIWDISIWKMIRCAWPANNGGCLIITTTRIFDIAKQVGVAYRMPPLCLQNSRILLHRTIFGTEDKDKYLDEELNQVSEKILQKCAGVPLAIIMISGLLATKGGDKTEWYKVDDSIGTIIKDSLDGDDMRKLLSLSYDDMPSHLRSCLLYLSVFQQGYEIGKDRLIRLWIAEDFIQCEKQGENIFEIGERYFYELIDRRMIQPVYKRWYHDMIEYCCIHDMVFELICSLSRKESIGCTLDHVHNTFPSKPVRWLSLQNTMADYALDWDTTSMQEMRSVVVFPSAVKLLSLLASFRDLRVLDLQNCSLSQSRGLNYLGNLVHLRYLGLRETGITELSEEIGKLICLETLDVTCNEISSLPSTVIELKHLMCLRIDSWTRAPSGTGSLTSLEELSTLRIQDSTTIIEDLSNQTGLRVLGIECHTVWNIKRFEKSLIECLNKLQNIHTLSISVVGECKLDAWVVPRHLRRLELMGCSASRLPVWLKPLLLLNLSFLSIEVRNLRQEDLEILGWLPALVYLDLEVGNQNLQILRRFVIGDCSFPCLVHCTLRGYMRPVVFQQGAMPRLARLHLAFPVRETREIAGGFDLGLGNLTMLQDVTFLLRRLGASKGEVEEAEAALRHAIQIHPNRPKVEILC